MHAAIDDVFIRVRFERVDWVTAAIAVLDLRSGAV